MSLEATNVSVTLGKTTIVNEVSLTAKPGTITAILGPNGSGKTTLLKCLAGDLQPSAGTVSLLGRPLTRWPLSQLAQHRAVLPQKSSLRFALSVLDVVLLGRLPFAERATASTSIASGALERVGVGHLIHRPFTHLSGGEQQRVQLARVLAQLWSTESGVLFLDEPTNNLDLTHQLGTLRLARNLADAGLAVVAILHDLNLASRVADQVLLLRDGRTQALGPAQDVLTPHNVSEVFDVPCHHIDHPDGTAKLLIPSWDQALACAPW